MTRIWHEKLGRRDDADRDFDIDFWQELGPAGSSRQPGILSSPRPPQGASMKANSDFRDLLRSLNAFGARYLVIGGYAVMIHSEPLYTKDLGIWIDPSPENANRVYAALAEFGAPLSKIDPTTSTDTDRVYQIGVEPNRIDILMAIPALSFDQAWPNRIEVPFDDEPAHVISIEDLLASKRATGRRKDREAVRALETTLKRKQKR